MTDIGRLKELEAKATITPWDVIMPLHKLDAVKIVGAIDGDADDDGRPRLSSTDICEMSDVPSEVDNALFIVKLRNAAPHLLSEIETLRARLAAAERVVEAARTYIMLEWESLDLPALNIQRMYEGWGAIPASEIALGESLAAYDQGKVTICDSAPTEGE